MKILGFLFMIKTVFAAEICPVTLSKKDSFRELAIKSHQLRVECGWTEIKLRAHLKRKRF